MTNTLLQCIQKQFPLTKLPANEFSSLKASGMKFTVECYRAEGLGHVSVMKAKGFFGLMKMDTLIVNPTAVDLPLYSYDRIFAMGNDTLIVELYDTLVGENDLSALDNINAEFADMPIRDPGKHWYDDIKLSQSISTKGKKAQTATFDKWALQHFNAYLSCINRRVDDVEGKKEKASYYVEGLLEKGGPSTDVFKKTLGVEQTAKLFREVLFGTK